MLLSWTPSQVVPAGRGFGAAPPKLAQFSPSLQSGIAKFLPHGGLTGQICGRRCRAVRGAERRGFRHAPKLVHVDTVRRQPIQHHPRHRRAAAADAAHRIKPFATRLKMRQHAQDLGQVGVVVERNGEAVGRAEMGTTVLADGDRLELVRAVAGG